MGLSYTSCSAGPSCLRFSARKIIISFKQLFFQWIMGVGATAANMAVAPTAYLGQLHDYSATVAIAQRTDVYFRERLGERFPAMEHLRRRLKPRAVFSFEPA